MSRLRPVCLALAMATAGPANAEATEGVCVVSGADDLSIGTEVRFEAHDGRQTFWKVNAVADYVDRYRSFPMHYMRYQEGSYTLSSEFGRLERRDGKSVELVGVNGSVPCVHFRF